MKKQWWKNIDDLQKYNYRMSILQVRVFMIYNQSVFPVYKSLNYI